MSHQTEIIKQETVSDECVAVTIRCCGDPSTDSTRTMHTTVRSQGNIVQRTAAEIQADVDGHHDEVAAKHAGKQAGKAALLALPNTTKIHNL